MRFNLSNRLDKIQAQLIRGTPELSGFWYGLRDPQAYLPLVFQSSPRHSSLAGRKFFFPPASSCSTTPIAISSSISRRAVGWFPRERQSNGSDPCAFRCCLGRDSFLRGVREGGLQ